VYHIGPQGKDLTQDVARPTREKRDEGRLPFGGAEGIAMDLESIPVLLDGIGSLSVPQDDVDLEPPSGQASGLLREPWFDPSRAL